MPTLEELAFTPEEIAERKQAALLTVGEDQQGVISPAYTYLAEIKTTLGRQLQNPEIAEAYNGLLQAYETGIHNIVGGVKLQADETVGRDEAELTERKNTVFGSLRTPMQTPLEFKAKVLGNVFSSIDLPTNSADASTKGPTAELAKAVPPVIDRLVREKVSENALRIREYYESHEERKFVVADNHEFSDENVAEKVIPEVDALMASVLKDISQSIASNKNSSRDDRNVETRQSMLGGLVAKAVGLKGERNDHANGTNESLQAELLRATTAITKRLESLTRPLSVRTAAKLLQNSGYEAVHTSNKLTLEAAVNAFIENTFTKDFVKDIEAGILVTDQFKALKRHVFLGSGRGEDSDSSEEKRTDDADSHEEMTADDAAILTMLTSELEALREGYKSKGVDNRTAHNRAFRKLARKYHEDENKGASSAVLARNQAILAVLHSKFGTNVKK